MGKKTAWLEIFRWGYVNIPGILFSYAKELDLELEDIGMMASLLYTLERTKPLYQTGIKVGQVMQVCPSLTKTKMTRRLNRLQKIGIIDMEGPQNLADREIFLDPLAEKLESLIIRDHAQFAADQAKTKESDNDEAVKLLQQYRSKIEQLELELEEEKNQRVNVASLQHTNSNYKKVADFISKKTGNLMSVKMAAELNKWLEEMGFSPEFLLCMLEMCFERSIFNPRDITQIAKDIKEYAINSVEGLESYFSQYIDVEKNRAFRMNKFDPDIAEFGSFTGIDMGAEARKKVYYKWRYDWGFSHPMIMKAGEVMCQRTKNGGLEYMDSVLHNWMGKEIRQVAEAEKEIEKFKTKNRKEKAAPTPSRKHESVEYEIFIPPSSLEGLKNKV